MLFLWIGVRTAFFGPGQKVEEPPLPVAATFPDEAAAGTAEQLAEASREAIRSAMVEASPEDADRSTEAVKSAVRDRLEEEPS